MDPGRWTVAAAALVLVSCSYAAPARPSPPPASVAPDLAGVGECLIAGRTDEARAAIASLLDEARRRGDRATEAGALLLQGLVDGSAGDIDAAVSSLELAHDLMLEQRDHFGAWLTLWSLGEVEKGANRVSSALGRYQEALAVLRQLETSVEPFSLETFIRLAAAFGMPEGPLSALGPMADVVKPIFLQFAEAVSRIGYGSSLLNAGQLETADRELARAGELAGLFGGALDASLALELGDLRRRQWRLEEARDAYRKALDGADAMPGPPVLRDGWIAVRILLRLAEIECLTGRMDEALAWNDLALKRVRTAGVVVKEADVLQERARILLYAGRDAEAERALSAALHIGTAAGDRYRQGTILSDLGFRALMGGDYQQAATRFEGALVHLEGLDQPYLESAIWSLLAETYFVLGAPTTAERMVERARLRADESDQRLAGGLVSTLEAWEAHVRGEGSLEEVRAKFAAFWSLPEAGGILAGDGYQALLPILVPTTGTAAKEGEDLSAELTELAGIQGPYFPYLARFLLGKLRFDAGDLKAARAEWTALLEDALAADNHDLAAGVAASIGVALSKEGRTDEAIERFADAIQHLEASARMVRVEELLTAYLGSERHWYYDVLIEALVRVGRAEEAFDFAERARARALLGMLGSGRMRVSRGADAALVDEAENLRAAIHDWENRPLAVPVGELVVDLDHARRRYEELLVRLKVSNPEYVSLVTVEPARLDDVQRGLLPNTSLISYYAGPSAVQAWVIDADSFQQVTLPLDRAAVAGMACWTEALERHGGQRGTEILRPGCGPSSSEELYDQLVLPLRPHLKQHTRVVVVPHAELHYVPFAALRDRGTGRYLVEDLTLSYSPSASVLEFLRAKETPVHGRALVYGNPAAGETEFRRLEWAEKEARAVADSLGVRPLLGSEATESRLAEAAGVDVLHLAAHAVYQPDSPLFSRILLAPDGHKARSDPPPATGEGDGSLTVDEIFARLDLAGVNLVVLSACGTARGRRTGGDEIVGLTRAFLYAGSPGVVSTLWNIDDRASAVLMRDLYRQWLAGVPVAEALRRAQINVLRTPGFEHPYYWAAFSLTGDPQGHWPHHSDR